MPATYGKRARRQSARDVVSPSPESRKRQKVSSGSATRTPSPTLTEPLENTLSSARITEHDDEESSSQKQNRFDASPIKPKKPARDLSGIFGAITSTSTSQASPSPSPTKLARRMLARSKTDSSITSETPADGSGGVDRTFSLPSLPSSLSPSRPARPAPIASKSSSALLPVLPPAAAAASPPKTRTYAGKYRSFLVNVPAGSSSTGPPAAAEDPSHSHSFLEDEPDFDDTRESYNSLRERWGVDNSEDDPYPHPHSYSYSQNSPTRSALATPDGTPSRSGGGGGGGGGRGKASSSRVGTNINNISISSSRPPPVPIQYPGGLSNPLKSISELRNKGESRRFLDELGYLFEGLDKSGGVGLRRSSALEICTKLCDADFARKAKAADLYARTWDLLVDAGGGQGDDKILDIIMAFFAALVARDTSSLAELASSSSTSTASASGPNFIDVLFTILSHTTPDADPLVLVAARPGSPDSELKRVGLGKRDRGMLTSVYQTITKSGLFKRETPISVSLLITHTLDILPSSSSSSATSLSPLHTPAHFNTFLQSLRYTLSPYASPSTSAASASTSGGSSASAASSSAYDGTLAAALALRWTDAAHAVPLQSVYAHLRLLDAWLLRRWRGVASGSGGGGGNGGRRGDDGEEDDDEAGDSQRTDVSEDRNGNINDVNDINDMREANERALENARDAWLARDLVALGVCAELVGGDGDGDEDGDDDDDKDDGDEDEDEDADENGNGVDTGLPKKCLDMTLRVLVSLTHSNAQWGRSVAEAEYTMGLLMRTIWASATGLLSARGDTSTNTNNRNGSIGRKGGRGGRGGRGTSSSPTKAVKAESIDDALKPTDDALMTSDDGPLGGPAQKSKSKSKSKSKAKSASQYMDTLCLALGLLTNLVQITEGAKKVLGDTSLNPSCPLQKRACARKCACPASKNVKRTSALALLADVYTRLHTKLEEASTLALSDATADTPEAHAEADAAFLRGHLAVLFGLLMMDCPRNQEELLVCLRARAPKVEEDGDGDENGDPDKVNLGKLVEQAKDFAAFYKAVSNGVVGEEESKVTGEVVRFLEALRDE